jgi:hypothetical protein
VRCVTDKLAHAEVVWGRSRVVASGKAVWTLLACGMTKRFSGDLEAQTTYK